MASRTEQADEPPQKFCGVFFVRSMASPLWAGRVGSRKAPRSCSRHANAVRVVATKRRKGEVVTEKERLWSKRLYCVVRRVLEREDATSSPYLFAPTRRAKSYTRWGWASSWKDAMQAWISTYDDKVEESTLTSHPMYFNLQDIRPAAITAKLQNRDADAYDFAAHANPATTHRHYDRRRIKTASATE